MTIIEAPPAVVVVCSPPAFLHRRILSCPVCKQRRRFAGREVAWYGITVSCCGCGDSWTDGERHERPFRRGWRKEAIAAAKRLWTEAAAFADVDHGQWLLEQFGEQPVEDVLTGGAL